MAIMSIGTAAKMHELYGMNTVIDNGQVSAITKDELTIEDLENNYKNGYATEIEDGQIARVIKEEPDEELETEAER